MQTEPEVFGKQVWKFYETSSFEWHRPRLTNEVAKLRLIHCFAQFWFLWNVGSGYIRNCPPIASMKARNAQKIFHVFPPHPPPPPRPSHPPDLPQIVVSFFFHYQTSEFFSQPYVRKKRLARSGGQGKLFKTIWVGGGVEKLLSVVNTHVHNHIWVDILRYYSRNCVFWMPQIPFKFEYERPN